MVLFLYFAIYPILKISRKRYLLHLCWRVTTSIKPTHKTTHGSTSYIMDGYSVFFQILQNTNMRYPFCTATAQHKGYFLLRKCYGKESEKSIKK